MKREGFGGRTRALFFLATLPSPNSGVWEPRGPWSQIGALRRRPNVFSQGALSGALEIWGFSWGPQVPVDRVPLEISLFL